MTIAQGGMPTLVVSEAEQEHVEVFEATQVARVIARSALQVAHSDVVAAFQRLEQPGSTEEAVQIIAEAKEQIEYALSMLRGKVWTLRIV